ncbi:MaoC family dehydratase [SAR202 cluster bacterium AD-804-J14_MRT_500m]|nr:MaoC family dehydratase [SAR202 cluster bacterium AD-804-J14_MRT_500m]
MESRLDELYERVKATLGRERSITSPEEMGRAVFRLYSTAVQDFNPVYTDQAYARKSGLVDVMAPPTLVCETFQIYEGDINCEGHPDGFMDLNLPVPLRAGNDYEFFRPVMPSDVITAKIQVSNVWKRAAKSGGLVFQEFEISYFNQNGDLLVRNVELMFYKVM